MKTLTLKSKEKVGDLWESKNYKGSYYQNWQIELSDGNKYIVSPKKTPKNPEALLRKNSGDTITIEHLGYEINNLPKVREIVGQSFKPHTITEKVINTEPIKQRRLDTGQSILLQVAYKGAIELACHGQIKLDEIKQFTIDHFKDILNK
tara:strand:- start:162 stop:608 length:447 start_codon:yes stop_codon:yes gene_type:complete